MKDENLRHPSNAVHASAFVLHPCFSRSGPTPIHRGSARDDRTHYLSRYSFMNSTDAYNRKSRFCFLAKPWPSSLAIKYQTGVPFFCTIRTICCDSLRGTRGSLPPATTKSGLTI